ncbi:MAG: AbrB/MazE/SpoVT family DNA-binding domain-containing protein [Candidatus Korobacteraceae bacterium]
MRDVKLSKRNQITIPRKVREALGLKTGDRLLVVERGGHLIVMPRPKSFAKAIRGLARGMYPEGYLDNERRSWD